ncbi:MAG TPA: hypothetical protein EYG89_01525, partial [Bacteroidia bacterium]|nr:hypothetical protein [Bacteroidia bacterium]
MKKILNMVIMTLLLLSQTLTADILSESMSSISNVSSYTESDGTQNVYSGSASIRFNFSKTPPPLFVFTPPSIEAGCNGIDIKGMFMSLLGLDQLGEMLQDAGASLAWGVAVGLIYSLPGVAAAFKMINAWAKKIQELLGNACQTGIAIGKGVAEESGINSSETAQKVNSFFASHSPETYAQKMQKGKSAIWDALGLSSTSTGPQMTKEEKDSTIVSMFKGVYQSDASILGAVLKDLALRTKGSSGTDNSYETLMGITTNNLPSSDAVSSVLVDLTSTKMATLANLVDISGGASNTSASQASLAMFAYILQYNFIGDLAITSPNKDRMKELYKIGSITSITDKSKALNAFKSAKKEKMSKLSLIKGYIGEVSEDAAGESLGKFIWYGINPNQPNQGESAKKYAAEYQEKMLAPVVEIITIRDDSSKNKSS